MLAIKLAKTGKTNKKMFRVIVSEKSRDPYGEVLEILGSYNPHSKALAVKADRVQHWLSKGAQMTASVNNLLVGQKIVEGAKLTKKTSGQASEKRLGQIKAKADKKAAREAAPAPTAKEEVVTEEAVTEEVAA
jgi:small subunit ribosomal protein S16